jgi:cardiolipin synthase
VTIPNFISIIRLALVPFIVWTLLEGEFMQAFILFVAVGISDGVDGFIARNFNQRTELGAYLDPLADKSLLIAVFVVLGYLEVIPVWLAISVVTRDVLIAAGVMVAFIIGNPVEIKPLLISKANTAVQIVLVSIAIGAPAFTYDLHLIKTILVWICGALTIASALAYFAAWTRHLTG